MGIIFLVVSAAILVAAVGVAVLALAYIVGPGLFYLAHKRPLEPRFVSIEEFPSLLTRDIGRRVRALQVLGFREEARFWFPAHSSSAPAYFSLLTHGETGESALVVATIPRGSSIPKAIYVELRARFEKGEVRTSNAPEPGVWTSPGSTTMWLPHARQIESVVTIHRHICSQVAPGERGRLHGEEQPEAFLAREMMEENEALAREGLLCLDEQSGVWRPTWRGACLLTWKDLWPQAGTRRAKAKAQADERLRLLI
jgi:hypothetical protein